MADRLIFQMHIRDHASPVIKAFNELLIPAADMPPMPTDLVSAEQKSHRGGCFIRLLPSAALLAWMAEVQARRETKGEAARARTVQPVAPWETSSS